MSNVVINSLKESLEDDFFSVTFNEGTTLTGVNELMNLFMSGLVHFSRIRKVNLERGVLPEQRILEFMTFCTRLEVHVRNEYFSAEKLARMRHHVHSVDWNRNSRDSEIVAASGIVVTTALQTLGVLASYEIFKRYCSYPNLWVNLLTTPHDPRYMEFVGLLLGEQPDDDPFVPIKIQYTLNGPDGNAPIEDISQWNRKLALYEREVRSIAAAELKMRRYTLPPDVMGIVAKYAQTEGNLMRRALILMGEVSAARRQQREQNERALQPAGRA